MKGTHRFERRGIVVDGAPRSAMTIKCCRCSTTGTVVDNKHGGLAVSKLAEKFRAKGWLVASRASGDLCPKHNLSPAQKRAAWCRMNNVPRKGENKNVPSKPTEKIVTTPDPVITADPPRQPSRDDRRRILEELEDSYDRTKDCYTGAGSDMQLAAKLSVPRAWVSELRDMMFGPDVNEAASLKEARLNELQGKLAALEEQALTLAQNAEALGREVRKALAK
jgi:hypothetical protein